MQLLQLSLRASIVVYVLQEAILFMCVCVFVCVRACVHARVCVHVHVHIHTWAEVPSRGQTLVLHSLLLEVHVVVSQPKLGIELGPLHSQPLGCLSRP